MINKLIILMLVYICASVIWRAVCAVRLKALTTTLSDSEKLKCFDLQKDSSVLKRSLLGVLSYAPLLIGYIVMLYSHFMVSQPFILMIYVALLILQGVIFFFLYRYHFNTLIRFGFSRQTAKRFTVLGIFKTSGLICIQVLLIVFLLLIANQVI